MRHNARASNSILESSSQKYRGYVLASFFVTNYILRIFATLMTPRAELLLADALSKLLFHRGYFTRSA